MQLASLMLIAASYLVDSSHTTAGFAVKHMMVATVRGQFDTVAGKVEIDDADLTRCRIDVTIEAASVDTRNAKRDEHLRGADFFDVAKYPFITFKSSHFEKAADGRLLEVARFEGDEGILRHVDRKSTRLNSSQLVISYAVFFF